MTPRSLIHPLCQQNSLKFYILVSEEVPVDTVASQDTDVAEDLVDSSATGAVFKGSVSLRRRSNPSSGNHSPVL